MALFGQETVKFSNLSQIVDPRPFVSLRPGAFALTPDLTAEKMPLHGQETVKFSASGRDGALRRPRHRAKRQATEPDVTGPFAWLVWFAVKNIAPLGVLASWRFNFEKFQFQSSLVIFGNLWSSRPGSLRPLRPDHFRRAGSNPIMLNKTKSNQIMTRPYDYRCHFTPNFPHMRGLTFSTKKANCPARF
jgi:hypothetical protein